MRMIKVLFQPSTYMLYTYAHGYVILSVEVMNMSDEKKRLELEEIDLRSLGYISTAEAAQILHKSEGHIRTLIYNEERLRAKRIGDRVFVEKASLDEYRPKPRTGRPKGSKNKPRDDK